jgi:putative tryptophan/tyrosine transport system substrate-binding protein
MRRRDFITLLSAAAMAWPVPARAQQPTMPVVGFLYTGTPESIAHLVADFRNGLAESGYIEGRNVAIEYRWAQNQNERLPELAADLVGRRVTVIVTPASMPASLAAKAATATIPIVFSTGGDPVTFGLVASLNQPGGNVTGVVSFDTQLLGKRLALLRDLLPAAIRFAVLVNPKTPIAESQIADARAASLAAGRSIEILTASTNEDIDAAFASLTQKRIDALVVSADNLFLNRGVQLITLAASHRMPAIYPFHEFANAGGLMSYGSSLPDSSTPYPRQQCCTSRPR